MDHVVRDREIGDAIDAAERLAVKREQVIAGAAGHRVGLRATQHGVGTAAAVESVGASHSIQVILAQPAGDHVIYSTTLDDAAVVPGPEILDSDQSVQIDRSILRHPGEAGGKVDI